MKNLIVRWISIVTFINCAVGDVEDYWDGDFDENKNCKTEELIRNLSMEQNPGRCALKSSGIGSGFSVGTIIL